MSFLELYHKHHRVPLDEMYKKVMANAKGCRSTASAYILLQLLRL